MSDLIIHRGEIVKNAVRNSGIKISELARKIGASRRFIYIIFGREKIALHDIRKIGEAINHDFSNEIIELKENVPQIYQTETFWKDKYIKLLEEYNELLKNKN